MDFARIQHFQVLSKANCSKQIKIINKIGKRFLYSQKEIRRLKNKKQKQYKRRDKRIDTITRVRLWRRRGEPRRRRGGWGVECTRRRGR